MKKKTKLQIQHLFPWKKAELVPTDLAPLPEPALPAGRIWPRMS